MIFRKKNKEKKDLGYFSKKYWRIHVLAFFVFLATVIILIRLYNLQVVAYEEFREKARNQHEFSETLNPERGEIFLREKQEQYPIAINQQLQMAYVIPKEVKDKAATVQKISDILKLEKKLVGDKLSNSDDLFEILKHKLSDEEVSKIRELKPEGVYLMPETFRFYPGGELGSQIVGFVGSDGEKVGGRYGIEAHWEKELDGKKGMLAQEEDTRGRWISFDNREMQLAENGVNLILTIDHTIQYETEKILKETIEKHQAENGLAIVMEAKTGKILAMANQPSFNPNKFNEVEDISVFSNSSISAVFECGSVFKPFVIAAGIDDGKISPETTYVDSGLVREAGYSIKNSDGKSNGRQTMTQVLEKSLNTGAIFAEKMLGNKKFSEYVRRFGFGEITGIDLPGEVAGNVKNLDNLKSNIQFFTSAFGQGISMTALQLVNAYAALANNGILMKPQIVDKIIYPNGTVEEIEPQEIRRVIKEDTAKQLGKMLRSVVVNGHGKRADVPGYLVGGKTGTAQVPKKEGRGYEEKITVGSFVGFAPVNDPQFVILVKIYYPKGVQWAESTAAPAFSRIMKFVMDYYRVEPTEEYDVEKLKIYMPEQEIKPEPVVNPVIKEVEKKDKNKNN